MAYLHGLSSVIWSVGFLALVHQVPSFVLCGTVIICVLLANHRKCVISETSPNERRSN